MEQRYSSWLTADRLPHDFYELLGERRLTPEHAKLEVAVRQATRDIFPYQNHSTKEVAQRAVKLLHQLGEAKSLLENPARLAEYQRSMFARLKEEYARIVRGEPASWDPLGVRNWLLNEQRLDEQVLPAILYSWGVHDSLEPLVTVEEEKPADEPQPEAPAQPPATPVRVRRRRSLTAIIPAEALPPELPKRRPSPSRNASMTVIVVFVLLSTCFAGATYILFGPTQTAAPVRKDGPTTVAADALPVPEYLAGTQWLVRLPNGSQCSWLFAQDGELQQDGRSVGPWKQIGDEVTVVVNNFATWSGKRIGTAIKGVATNQRGSTWNWSATLVRVPEDQPAAAQTLSPTDESPSLDLVGTTWTGMAAGKPRTYEFLADGVLHYTTGDKTFTNATWFQTGDTVTFEMNDGFAVYSGKIRDDQMRGTARNQSGSEWAWGARRNPPGGEP